jgi:hypothetical protein
MGRDGAPRGAARLNNRDAGKKQKKKKKERFPVLLYLFVSFFLFHA